MRSFIRRSIVLKTILWSFGTLLFASLAMLIAKFFFGFGTAHTDTLDTWHQWCSDQDANGNQWCMLIQDRNTEGLEINYTWIFVSIYACAFILWIFWDEYNYWHRQPVSHITVVDKKYEEGLFSLNYRFYLEKCGLNRHGVIVYRWVRVSYKEYQKCNKSIVAANDFINVLPKHSSRLSHRGRTRTVL